MTKRLVELDRLSLRYGAEEPLRLKEVSLHMHPGERLVLVGESGAGKSSLIAALSGFLAPASGSLKMGGVDPYLAPHVTRQIRRQLGIIRQQARASLDPAQSALEAVAEVPQHLKGEGRTEARSKAVALLTACGLSPLQQTRRPHALSGGECQRVAAARALVHQPRLVLADEPTASLDPIVGAELLATLLDRVDAAGTALLYVTHNLAEPARIKGQLGVLLEGWLVERRRDFSAWTQLRHPYSLYLARARLEPVPPRRPSEGVGCPFAGACPHADEACREAMPPEQEVGPGHHIRCRHPQ